MGNACVSGGEHPHLQPAPVPPACPEGPPTCIHPCTAPQAVGRVDLASALNDPLLHPASAYTCNIQCNIQQAVGRVDLASVLNDPLLHPVSAHTCSAPQAVGRVDLASVLNDAALHLASAYTPTERLLARLEALTLVAPVCQEQHAHMYRHALSSGVGMRGYGTGASLGALPCEFRGADAALAWARAVCACAAFACHAIFARVLLCEHAMSLPCADMGMQGYGTGGFVGALSMSIESK